MPSQTTRCSVRVGPLPGPGLCRGPLKPRRQLGGGWGVGTVVLLSLTSTHFCIKSPPVRRGLPGPPSPSRRTSGSLGILTVELSF